MNALALAFRPRVRALPVFLAFALLASCNGGDTGNDGSTDNDGATTDGAMDAGTHADATTDGPRLRDTGPEISLDSALTNCTVQVEPRSGPASSTFVVTGRGFLSSPMVALTIGPEGGTPFVNMQIPVDSSGGFTFSQPGTGLAPGDYSATATDPTFTCTFTGPFTVTP
jgi:hypothetical protein